MSPVSLNLSYFFPDFRPIQLTSLANSIPGKFRTNSPASATRLWE